MVVQKLLVSQNFNRILPVSQSRFYSGYVRLAVSLFIRRCLGVSTFGKAKGLKVPISLLVMTSFRRLILYFIKATFNFRKKVNLNFF